MGERGSPPSTLAMLTMEWPRAWTIVETGAQWPSWLGARCAVGCRVIEQGDSESPAELASRAASELERAADLARIRADLEAKTVVMACGEREDPVANAARRALARRVVIAIERAGGGELFFAAPERGAGRVRPQLVELASHVGQGCEGRSVLVSVRFGTAVNMPTCPGTDPSAGSGSRSQSAGQFATEAPSKNAPHL